MCLESELRLPLCAKTQTMDTPTPHPCRKQATESRTAANAYILSEYNVKSTHSAQNDRIRQSITQLCQRLTCPSCALIEHQLLDLLHRIRHTQRQVLFHVCHTPHTYVTRVAGPCHISSITKLIGATACRRCKVKKTWR